MNLHSDWFASAMTSLHSYKMRIRMNKMPKRACCCCCCYSHHILSMASCILLFAICRYATMSMLIFLIPYNAHSFFISSSCLSPSLPLCLSSQHRTLNYEKFNWIHCHHSLHFHLLFHK